MNIHIGEFSIFRGKKNTFRRRFYSGRKREASGLLIPHTRGGAVYFVFSLNKALPGFWGSGR